MKHILIEDPYGSLIQLSFYTDNENQIFLTMKQDIFKSTESDFYPPDSIIDYKEYSNFIIRVFQEIAKTHIELRLQEPVKYFDFLDILLEADMIEYNEKGNLYFKE